MRDARHIAVCGALFALSAAGGTLRAQQAELPVVTISGPTVIAFWRAPQSDSHLIADPDLASALDQQQTYWADSYGRLRDLGIVALTQAGRRFQVQDGLTVRVFEASPDSSDIGYLLVSPGRDFRVLYRLWFPNELVHTTKEHFGLEHLLRPDLHTIVLTLTDARKRKDDG